MFPPIPLSKNFFSQKATSLLVFLLFALFAFSFYAEQIPVNNGAGFDGAFYREVFRNFSTDIFAVGYDSFRIQRIFPFCLMNMVYNLAGIPLDNAHMMAGMVVCHFLNLAVQVLFFFKLAKLQGWKSVTKVILFSLFFFNFAVLKDNSFEPFQTDAFAVTIALVSYYVFLTGKNATAFAISLLGLVTWPTVTYVMIPLIIFQNKGNLASAPGPFCARFFRLLPFAYAVPAIALVALSFILHKEACLNGLLLTSPKPSLIIFSLVAIVVCGWLVASTQKLPPFPYTLTDVLKSFRLRPAIGITICIVSISAILRIFANEEFFFDGKLFLLQVIARPLKFPLITFVGHFVYWGLLPVFLLIFARDFVKEFMEKSPGHALALLFFIFFALDSEGRHIAPLLPLLLVPLGSVLDKANFAPKAAFFTVISQLILSHFYMTINVDGFTESLEQGDFFTPVAQRFFMNNGPWMTDTSYFCWIAIAFAAIIITIVVFKHAKRPQSGQ